MPLKHARSPKPMRYVDVCQTQSSASLCDVKVERTRIDCCFLMSKTRWGQLHNKPSGVMYLDLTFHQPSDCKLAQATITMNFQKVQGTRPTALKSLDSDLEVTEFFGPQTLSGEKRERQVSTTLEVNPKLGTGSTNIEGSGWSQRSEMSYASRWKFTGSRFVTEPSSSLEALDSRSSRYQQLVWHLEENELEKQAVHHSTVHSAVAFHHDSQPFHLDVQIEVKLHRWHHRLKQLLVCPPRNRRACARARIDATSNVDPDVNFAQLARNLDHAMTETNLHPVFEVPDPRPILVNTSCEDKESDTETSAGSLPNERLVALVGQLTGQNPPTVMAAKPSSFMDSSSSTLIESDALKESNEQAEPDATVAEPEDSLAPDPPKQQGGLNTLQESVLRAVFSVVCQASWLLAALIASFVSGLNGLHSVLVQIGK